MPATAYFVDGTTRAFETAKFVGRQGDKVVLHGPQGEELAALNVDELAYVVLDDSAGRVEVVEGTKIIPRSRREHDNGLSVSIHQFSRSPLFGAQFSDQQGPAVGRLWGTEKEAQDAADRIVAEETGHRCSQTCSAWFVA